MAADLETLKREIEAYLHELGIAVFYGYSIDSPVSVYWDTERHPDFREFIVTGRNAGARLVVFSHETLSQDEIDEALDQLEESDLAWDDKHKYENRLRELQAFEGFTCSIELSFEIESRIYLYQMRTAWYQTLKEILAELDTTTGLEDEDEDDGPMAGYFSRN